MSAWQSEQEPAVETRNEPHERIIVGLISVRSRLLDNLEEMNDDALLEESWRVKRDTDQSGSYRLV